MIQLGMVRAQETETTTSLLQQAIEHTRWNQFIEARRVYEKLVVADPSNGYPLFARFLERTGETTQALELLDLPAVQQLPPLSRARIALAAGNHERATEFLREPVSPQDEYPRIVLLAKELRFLKRDQEAAQVLLKAILESQLSPEDRLDLLTKLNATSDPVAVQSALLQAIDRLINESEFTVPEIREVANAALTRVSQDSNFASFHQRLAQEKQTSPTVSWLFALSSIRRGDNPGAIIALRESLSQARSSRERLFLNEELARLSSGDPAAAAGYFQNALLLASDPDRIRLSLAQCLYRLGDFKALGVVLRAIDSRKLLEVQQTMYANMTIAYAATIGPAETVTAYEKAAVTGKWAALKELAEAAFVSDPGTTKAAQLLKAAQLSAQSQDSTATLEALIAVAARQAGDIEAGVAAIARFLQHYPADTDAIKELAEARFALTKAIAAQPQRNEALLKENADEAARYLWEMVKARPYEPEAYTSLIELYKTCGEEDKARRVPQYLTAQTTATPEDIHFAAFILATNNFPEDALPLYEKALKSEPDNPKFRLNYAGCLSRLERVKDAMNIYRDMIKNGARGKQYHTHELYANAYTLALTTASLGEFITFLKSLIDQPDVADYETFLSDAAGILASNNRYDDALPFLETLSTRFPHRRDDVRQMLTTIYIHQKKFDKADILLGEAEAASTNTQDLVANKFERAYVKSMAGDTASAVKQWETLAREYPDSRQATRGLVAAAQLLVRGSSNAQPAAAPGEDPHAGHDHGPEESAATHASVDRQVQLTQARELLERYIGLNTGDTDAEQAAREMLASIGQ